MFGASNGAGGLFVFFGARVTPEGSSWVSKLSQVAAHHWALLPRPSQQLAFGARGERSSTDPKKKRVETDRVVSREQWGIRPEGVGKRGDLPRISVDDLGSDVHPTDRWNRWKRSELTHFVLETEGGSGDIGFGGWWMVGYDLN